MRNKRFIFRLYGMRLITEEIHFIIENSVNQYKRTIAVLFYKIWSIYLKNLCLSYRLKPLLLAHFIRFICVFASKYFYHYYLFLCIHLFFNANHSAHCCYLEAYNFYRKKDSLWLLT